MYAFVFAGMVAVAAASCKTDLDCSLNGVCTNSNCICDKPWSGQACETMNFRPVSFPQGYGMSPNVTTWGGGAIFDGQKYHIFVSRMTNDCLLRTWGHNSRIDHGVADQITGPYKFVDVAVNTWSHNAAPVTLHDGSYAIFHIGDGTGPPNGGSNCTPTPPTPCTSEVPGYDCANNMCMGSDGGDVEAHVDCGNTLKEPPLDCKAGDELACSKAAAAACDATPGCAAFGLSTRWSDETKAKLFQAGMKLVPNSDWKMWTKKKIGQPTPVSDTPWVTFQEFYANGNLNPSTDLHPLGGGGGGSTIHISKSLDGPWVPLANNTLGGCNNPAPWVHPNGTIYIVCGGSLKRSESLSGPWDTVTHFSHQGGPAGNWEDPYLYTDHRGHFHLIYHVYNTHENPPHGHECFNSTVSAHQFSEDGFTWGSSATSPYGTQVELVSGTTITVATRERPKLFFDSTGHMTHLFNGVCSAPNCPNGPRTGCVDCKYANWDYTLVQPLAL